MFVSVREAPIASISSMKMIDGLFFFARLEELAHEAGPLADVLLDEFGADHAQEVGLGLVRDGLREQGLARAGRAVEEHALRRLDPDPLEEFRLLQGQLDRLLDLQHLPVEPADVVVALGRRVHDLHPVDLGVEVGGQDLDDRERLLVQGAPGPGLDLLDLDVLGEPDQEPRARRRPDDHPCRVDHVRDGPDHERRALHLLDLGLELPHLAFVSDLLGLQVPLVRLELAELLADLRVPVLQRSSLARGGTDRDPRLSEVQENSSGCRTWGPHRYIG